MPFISDEELGFRPVVPLPAEPPRPPADEIFNASLRQSNWLVSALTRMANTPPGGFPMVDGYRPWDEVKKNPLWLQYADEFAGSRSPEQSAAIGRGLEQREADHKTLAASGGLGVIAGAYSGLMDPTLALPGSIAIKALKEGPAIVRGAIQVGMGAATQQSAQEALFATQQPGARTAEDRVYSIGSAAIIGALLGTGAAFMSPADRAAATASMDASRARVDAHVMGVPSSGPGVDLGEGAAGRLAQSDNVATRRALNELLGDAAVGKVGTEGKPSTLSGGPPLDRTVGTQQEAAQTKLHDAISEAWTEHNLKEKAEGAAQLPYEDFSRAVADAVMAGGKHELPQVQRAAGDFKTFLDGWGARTTEPAPPPIEGEGSFPRLWDKPTITADREKFEAQLTDHLAANQKPEAAAAAEAPKPEPPKSSAFSGYSYDEATKTMEVTFKTGKTYVYEGVPKDEYEKFAAAPSAGKHFNANIRQAYKGRLKEAVEKPEPRPMGTPDASMQALRAQAKKATDDILATPDGQVARGPGLDVSNAFARNWIERDIEKVAQAYLRTVAPDAVMAERVGDPTGKPLLDAVTADYAEKIAAAEAGGPGGPTEMSKRLEKHRDADLADLQTLLDRVSGNHGISSEAPIRNIGKVAEAVQALAGVHMMGLSALQSIPGIASAISHWGLETTFKDAWGPLFRSLAGDQKLAVEAARQAKVMGIALDAADARAARTFGSPIETTLAAGADPMQLLNMIAPQTNILRTAASVVSSTELYRTIKAAEAGTATAEQLAALERAGIPEALRGKIAEQYEKSGTEIDGVMLPNTETWTSETREAFEGAVRRDVDTGVNRGGKPDFIHDFILGVIEPMKEFLGASTTELLKANLPRAAAWLLQGTVGSLAMAALKYKLESTAGGKKTSRHAGDWVREMVERSKLLGEGSTGTKAARGSVDLFRTLTGKPSAKRNEDRSRLDQLVGPTTMDKLTGMTGGGEGVPGDWNADDVTAHRRLTATQHLYWLQQTLTKANRNLGIP